MFGYIRGVFAHKSPTQVIIENNGIGYEVNISLNTYSHIQDKESGMLYTYLHIKEDGHTLYGFSDEKEKQLFQQLISVSGVGPTTARMVLSSLTPDELQSAISTENVVLITKIKGIGAKTAQRLILELKDKIFRVETSPKAVLYNTPRQEALSALVMLGFARNTAEKAIDKAVSEKDSGSDSVEGLIKRALKYV